MTWTFQNLDLFVLSCLVLTFESHTSEVLPPQNVTLIWITDFEPQLSWAPPRHSAENCTYEVERSVNEEYRESYDIKTNQLSWSRYTVMEGRFLYLSVKTICNHTQSERIESPITYPELVRNVTCYIQSSKLTRCSWLPASDAPDLGFFFRLVAEDLTTSVDDDSDDTPLQACPAYTDRRTGCELQAGIRHDIHILFNGTLNNRPVRNTYTVALNDNVRPLPPKWTVIKAGEKFKISWNPPDFGSQSSWKFIIKHTVCNETKIIVEETNQPIELSMVPHCEHCMAIRVERKLKGRGSEWSDEECFEADSRPNALVYAAIIIPLMFAVLAALTLVCCKKNKDIIFPRVPEPRNFLNDISDNNNKITVRNLYIPEEEDCKITLVIDPLNNKLLS